MARDRYARPAIRRGQRDVRQPLETFDVVALLHDARRQADERQISRGVDPEYRAACAVITKSLGRVQRAKVMAADLLAAQREPEPKVRRPRLPSPAQCERSIQLVRMLASVDSPGHGEHRRTQNSGTGELAAATQRFGKTQQIPCGRHDAQPRHFGRFVLQRAVWAISVTSLVACGEIGWKVRHDVARP